jgi:hypothetical protein
VGEGLLEERGAGRLAGRVGGAADRAVLRRQGLGELAGQVFLGSVEEVQREDATALDQVVGVLVLFDR